MTQTLWRPFGHGDAPALAYLFRDAVMQLATADYGVAARAFAQAGFRVSGEETVERNGVSLMRLRMQKPLGALPVQT
jgi:hypothetical protein